MEGREESDPGYDDWFDEPEPLTETQSGANRGVYQDAPEVWSFPEDEAPRRGGHGGEIVIGNWTLTTTQAAIVAVSIVAVVLALLAATGAFSSGRAAVPPVTTPSVPSSATNTRPATTPTPPTAQAPHQTLKPGDTGPQVKLLQKALAALGLSPGKADGDYGPATQTEVEKFQLSKGLAEDGIVGPQTLAALQKALSP